MIRPLIIKAGTTVSVLRERRGDFEHWIADGMGLAHDAVDVVSVFDGGALPDPASPPAVIVTGSAAMVTERADWSERTAEWLARVVGAGTPVLGICYGHQLIAHGLGGCVAANPRGREIGTVSIDVLPDAKNDPLLGAIGQPGARIAVQQSHSESVLELPPGARRLAENAHDPNQAYALGECTWGVQFHPEFDADVTRTYLEVRADAVREEGLDPEALAAAVTESSAGPTLLRRFAALLGG